jgi:hypothetical protein
LSFQLHGGQLRQRAVQVMENFIFRVLLWEGKRPGAFEIQGISQTHQSVPDIIFVNYFGYHSPRFQVAPVADQLGCRRCVGKYDILDFGVESLGIYIFKRLQHRKRFINPYRIGARKYGIRVTLKHAVNGRTEISVHFPVETLLKPSVCCISLLVSPAAPLLSIAKAELTLKGEINMLLYFSSSSLHTVFSKSKTKALLSDTICLIFNSDNSTFDSFFSFPGRESLWQEKKMINPLKVV